MWTPALDPVIVDILGLEIRYYGLVYALGFVFALFWLLRKRITLGLSKDDVYDLLFYAMIGVLIGGRLFHIIFWEPSYYLHNPWKIIAFWEGGMAYYGGLVGICVAGYIYCRKKNLSFLKIADALSVPAVVALGLGRLANFVNGELVGTVTNVSWCVNFGDGLCRHPYQLYSAAKRFLIAGLLLGIGTKKDLKDGLIFWSLIFLISLGRFFLDFVREESLVLGLRMGQWMSLIAIILSGYVLYTRYKQDIKNILK